MFVTLTEPNLPYSFSATRLAARGSSPAYQCPVFLWEQLEVEACANSSQLRHTWVEVSKATQRVLMGSGSGPWAVWKVDTPSSLKLGLRQIWTSAPQESWLKAHAQLGGAWMLEECH